MKKILLSLVFLFIVACSTDTTDSESNPMTAGTYIIGQKDDLPKCDQTHEKHLVYLTETNELLYCINGSWTTQRITESTARDTIYKQDTLKKINRVIDTLYVENIPDLENLCTAEVDTSNYHRMIVTCGSSSFSTENKNAHLTATTYGDDIIDSRDGHIYKTVVIGQQTWMAENLNYAVDSSYCYNDSIEYCEQFGRLYKWAAAMGASESECGIGRDCMLDSIKIQGVCPKGFHLPLSQEWQELFDFVETHNGRDSATIDLLSLDGGYYFTGHDLFGFNLKPAPKRSYSGTYPSKTYLESYVMYWTATEYYAQEALCWYKDDGYGTCFSGHYGNSSFHQASGCNKADAISVRCVKD